VSATDPGVDGLAGAEAPARLAALRAHGAVVRVASLDAWLVLTHDAAVEVMRDPTTYTVDDPRFSTARVVGPSMLSLDGPEHRRHRGPFVAPFRPSKVTERYAASTARLADGLLDAVRADGRAELRTTLAGPLSVAVMARLLGLDGDDGVDPATVLRWYAAIVAGVSRISAGGAPGSDATAAMAGLGAEVTRVTRPGSVLAGARETLSEDEVVANAAVMMFGGIETTEGMIFSVVAHLLAAPDVLAAVRADPALVAAVVEESLRLEPAAAVVDRYVTRDVRLRGVPLRRGDLVRVSLTAANRDPAVFAEPDRFDPSRPRLREQLSFAQGPHVCLAMDLARLEAREAVHAVAALPGVRLTRAEPATGLVFRKPAEVHVAWDVPGA
jgi:cytochrome P450